MLEDFYKKCFGSAPSDRRIQKDISNLMKKIPSYLPVLTNAFFRFFDADGSGTISKEEIVMAVGSLFTGPRNGPNKNLFIPALFRMIDENNNGSIEAVEVQPFVTEIITTAAKIVLSIVEQLENDLKDGMKNKILKKLKVKMDSWSATGMPYPITSDFIIDLLSTLSLEGMEQVAKSLQFITPEIIAGYDIFADRFKAVSQGNPVPIKKVAALMTEIVVPPVCAIADPDLAAAMLPEPSHYTVFPY